MSSQYTLITVKNTVDEHITRVNKMVRD